jgi:hypothetical protein
MRRLISISLSSQSAPIIEIASWRSRRSPLGQPRTGERCPPRLQSGIEHVAAGEVLDQETVGVAPEVEQRAALNVAAVRVIQNHRKVSACSLPASLRVAMSLNPQIAKHRSSSARKDFR